MNYRDFCPGCDEVVIPPCASCENVRLNKVVNRLADMVNIYRDMVTDYRRMRGECELCFMTREEIIQDVAESIDD